MTVKKSLKKLVFLTITILFVLVTTFSAWGQVTLGTSPYTETFDNIGSGLPSGYTVRTSATVNSIGTLTTFNTSPTSFGTTTGQFANYASSDGLTSDSTVAIQGASTDRVIGLRQTDSFGDPGAAFVLQLANTIGRTSLSLTFRFQTLSVQGRDTTFTVDYGIGTTPPAFTSVATINAATAFGTQTTTVNFGTALDNKSGPVFIRIVALTASTGSGSRDTSAIDDLSLSFLITTAAPSEVGGRITQPNGRGIFRARVTLTDSQGIEQTVYTNQMGFYNFAEIPGGQSYIFSVAHRRFEFNVPSRVEFVGEDNSSINFVSSSEGSIFKAISANK